MSYHPDTGDAVFDQELSDALAEEWAYMGVECSMQESFSRVADVFLPTHGDSALQWYRDEGRLRLLEITSDRIGEPFSQFVDPKDMLDGEKYISGLYMRGPNVVGYKIYERDNGMMLYSKGQRVPASEIIFFRDDIDGGMRGVSKFATALADIHESIDEMKYYREHFLVKSAV